MKTNFTLTDHGQPLTVTFEGCTQYHGRDSIGGMTLGFALVEFAVSRLGAIMGCPLPREGIRFETAFPGPGVQDAVEFTTRAVSRGNWVIVDPDTVPDAPEGVYGRLWFALTTPTHRVVMQIRPGVLSEDFIKTGRQYKSGDRPAELLTHWTELKEGLAKAVENTDIETLMDWSIEVIKK